VSDDIFQPIVSQINTNERKRPAEEVSHTTTTPPNLRPLERSTEDHYGQLGSVEEKEADDKSLFSVSP